MCPPPGFPSRRAASVPGCEVGVDCLPPLLPAASGLVRRQVGPEGQSLHPGEGQEGQDGAGRAEPDRAGDASYRHCHPREAASQTIQRRTAAPRV
jgi:hypothetical protein